MISTDKKQDREKASTKVKPVLVSLFAIIMILFLSEIVFAADITGALSFNFGSGIKGGISNYFSSYANDNNPQLLDLVSFTVMFFALCWVGFSAVFKDAKNANVMLSLSVGVVLSVALVYGGKFTMKRALPLAGVLIFFAIVLWMFSMLKKFVFTKDTMLSKVLSGVFAVMICFALLVVLINSICVGNACEQNMLFRKTIGSESALGKMFSGMDSTITGSGPMTSAGSTRGGTGPAPKPVALCGNGKVDGGEKCDETAKPNGCKVGGVFRLDQVCDNCNACLDQSIGGSVIDNWPWAFAAVAGIFVIITFIHKRKDIKESVRKAKKNIPLLGRLWRTKSDDRKDTLEKVLTDIQEEEKKVVENFKKLYEALNNEKTTFDQSRHIIDVITTDIKETIGQEIDLIKSTEDKGSIEGHIAQLSGFNNTESHIITQTILPNIVSQIDKLAKVPEPLRKEIDELERAHEHFKENAEILETFKQHNFSEKNIITNIIKRLDENKKSFEEMNAKCGNIIKILEGMHDDVTVIEGKNIDYPTVVMRIKDIRYKALQLNRIFSEKVNLLHYFVVRLKELKNEMGSLNEKERANVNEFLRFAKKNAGEGKMDTAIYFASHVLESADHLDNKELNEASRRDLANMKSESRDVIKNCLPKLFDSVKPSIQEELNKGEFVKVMTFAEAEEGRLEIIKRYDYPDFEKMIRSYEEKMEALKDICGRLNKGEKVEQPEFTKIGLDVPKTVAKKTQEEIDAKIDEAKALEAQGDEAAARQKLGEARSMATAADNVERKEKVEGIARSISGKDLEDAKKAFEKVCADNLFLSREKLEQAIGILPVRNEPKEASRRKEDLLNTHTSKTLEDISSALSHVKKDEKKLEEMKKIVIGVIDDRIRDVTKIRDEIEMHPREVVVPGRQITENEMLFAQLVGLEKNVLYYLKKEVEKMRPEK